MAAAVPFIVKAIAGAVVSKIVGKITGSELLGAIAGGFVGGGLNLDMATGAASWTNVATGTTRTLGGAAGSEVIAGGSGMATGTLGANAGGIAPELIGTGAEQAARASVAASAPSVTGGAANIATGVGKAITAGSAGAAPQASTGILSKAAGFLDKHPGLAEIGFKGLSAAMQPDQEDLLEKRLEGDIELARVKAGLDKESKEAVDAEALHGLLRQYGSNIQESTGYRPQGAILREGGYQPMYMTRVSPNRQAMIDELYEKEGAE